MLCLLRTDEGSQDGAFVAGKADGQNGPWIGPPDGNPAAEVRYTFSHTPDANAQGIGLSLVDLIKANAVVAYDKVQASSLAHQAYGRMPCARMPVNVGQGFLGQAIDCRFHRSGSFAGI